MITQSINEKIYSSLSRKELTNKKFVQFFLQQNIFQDFLKTNQLSLPWRQGPKLAVVEHYLAAFTHSSFLNEFKDLELKSYEKLEFFGDVILNFLLTEMIFNQFAEFSEGELSKFKSAIVAKAPLARLAKAQKLDLLLLQGRGELVRPLGMNILGDLFESVLGAIYKHQGMKRCRLFLERSIALHDLEFSEVFLNPDLIESSDHKTKLQELTMKLFRVLPRYEGEQLSSGTFQVELFVGEKLLSVGVDKSKKMAEKKAAKEAFEKILEEQDLNHQNSRGEDYAH